MNLRFIFSIIYTSQVIHSQVVFRSSHLRAQNEPIYTASDLMSVPVFTLPMVDNNQLILAEQQNVNNNIHTGPYIFGKDFDVDLSLNDGRWEQRENGVWIWRLRVESIGAYSLNMIFSKFDMPADGEFYVRSSSNGDLRGPFTRDNVREDKTFAVAPLGGDELVLEYFTQDRLQKPKIRVSKVIHGFKNIDTLGKSGECNINVACHANSTWSNAIRSVAMILLKDGTGFCSGAMINNGKRDGRQLFLTAYHCVGGSDVTNNMLMFNYQSQSCMGSDRSAPQTMTAHGMKKVAQWYDSDFALVELLEPIPEEYNVYMAGWSATEDVPPLTPVGIHHPSTDVKKITFANLNATDSCWGWCDPSDDSLDHWKVPRWHQGTTEPGSSGSPLFDSSSHRIVGQLHGGSASCYRKNGYDLYGKVSYSFDQGPSEYNQLVHALDPDAVGIKAMDGDDLNELKRRKSVRFMVQN